LDDNASATPKTLDGVGATNLRALDDDQDEPMTLSEFRISRRPLAVAAVLVGMVSLAIGAHAALNMRALDAAKSVTSDVTGTIGKNKPSRVALVIGNGHYPDANAPLTQPINDARALTSALRRDGFDVDVVEDATRDDMDRAIVRLKAKLKPDSVVMLFFGGYGVQVGRESYMIPVDAAIWKESDVRRDGLSVESVLDAMKEQGACAKLVVIDASRRNPYERRFRTFSHGLAPITAPDNALILTSATPGQVADDSAGQHSVLMSELLANLNSLNAGESNKTLADRAAAAEAIFNKTRIAISRASDGAQVPSVSSSLLEDVRFGVTANAGG
jgi:uncharacterized caspase-like protein